MWTDDGNMPRLRGGGISTFPLIWPKIILTLLSSHTRFLFQIFLPPPHNIQTNAFFRPKDRTPHLVLFQFISAYLVYFSR